MRTAGSVDYLPVSANRWVRWDLAEFFDRHWRFFETTDTTDHPLPAQGSWQVTGLGLPDSVLAKLYFENAVRLFKLGRGNFDG